MRSLLAGVLMAQMFAADASGQAPARDNLAIPDTVPRSPLGTLGHVETIGTGPVPLILLPGAPFGWRVWENFARRNASRYTMYAVTPAGYDGTPPPMLPASASIEDRPWSGGIAAGVAELIRSKRLDRPVIVANHTMAAYYALLVARDRGCEIGGVIALSSAPKGTASTKGPLPPDSTARATVLREQWIPFFREVGDVQWRQNMFAPVGLSADTAVGGHWYREQFKPPLYVPVRYYLEFLSDDIGQSLRNVRIPILAVGRIDGLLGGLSDATRDMFVRRFGSVEAAEDSLARGNEWERVIKRRNPSVTTHYMRGTRALMMFDQPARVDSLVADFVANRRGCIR